jgi:hypothetical protein
LRLNFFSRAIVLFPLFGRTSIREPFPLGPFSAVFSKIDWVS